jgi:hypothetical protein
MAEILELRTVKNPEIIIDDTIDDTILFPEKLAEAKAKFAKYGLPKGLERKTAKKSEESAFWLSGSLQRADAADNTFLLISLDKDAPTNYTINTVPEMLHKLVKTSWCATIQVYIQPQINDKKQLKYELIEVKVD